MRSLVVLPALLVAAPALAQAPPSPPPGSISRYSFAESPSRFMIWSRTLGLFCAN